MSCTAVYHNEVNCEAAGLERADWCSSCTQDTAPLRPTPAYRDDALGRRTETAIARAKDNS